MGSKICSPQSRACSTSNQSSDIVEYEKNYIQRFLRHCDVIIGQKHQIYPYSTLNDHLQEHFNSFATFGLEII